MDKDLAKETKDIDRLLDASLEGLKLGVSPFTILSQIREHSLERITLQKRLTIAEQAETKRLEQGIHDLYNAGCQGIAYVGMANYAEREREAQSKLYEVYHKIDKG